MYTACSTAMKIKSLLGLPDSTEEDNILSAEHYDEMVFDIFPLPRMSSDSV